jgi:hypothetical protein
MLARDEQVRPRPPVTLPGSPRADDDGTPTKSGMWPTAAISSPPTPIPRVRDIGESGRRADRFEKAKARASEPGDQRNGNWTHEQLERMNAQFCQQLAWPIGRGLEQAPQGSRKPRTTGLDNRFTQSSLNLHCRGRRVAPY